MSVKFISIDTASTELVITSFDGVSIDLYKTKAINNGKNVILTAINELNIDFTELSFIIFINGPGSFTGLRIGQMAVQSLAFSFNLKCMCISSLQLKAQQCFYALNVPKVNIAMPALNAESFYGTFIKDRYHIMQASADLALVKDEDLTGTSIIKFTGQIEDETHYKKAILALGLQRGFSELLIEPMAANALYLKEPNLN